MLEEVDDDEQIMATAGDSGRSSPLGLQALFEGESQSVEPLAREPVAVPEVMPVVEARPARSTRAPSWLNEYEWLIE